LRNFFGGQVLQTQTKRHLFCHLTVENLIFRLLKKHANGGGALTVFHLRQRCALQGNTARRGRQ